MMNALETARRAWIARIAALVACAAPTLAHGWIYPEHRDIAALGIQKLDPERQKVLAGLWSEARAAHEKRLCEKAADTTLGEKPPCIDWAALPALSGDHSCSSKDLTETVLDSSWVLGVAEVAATLKDALARVEVLPPTQQVSGAGSPITAGVMRT